ncbi:MAG: ABC transporter ATP-binding protein [Saprospiraceae bacterium]|nr:ABC transporter ATP-binding protein [Saprospiraceae bacterium]MCB0681282.1 ABC transporter ATP-binding protein [Saprospiraceae bacterium]
MRNYFRILRFARPYRKQILLSVIFNLLVVLFSLGSITILIPVLKILFENTQQQPQPLPFQGLLQLREYLESQLNYHIVRWSGQIGAQRVLLYILGVATLLFILKNACRYLGGVFLAFIKNGVERDLRTSIHAKVLDLPLAFFTEKHKGDIVARLTTDITEIQWAFMSSIQRMIQDPLMILSTILLLVVLSPKLTLFVVVLIPVTGFVITAVGNTLKRPSARAKEELGRILSYVEEHLGGLPIIKSYVAERTVQRHFQASNERYFRAMNQMLFRRELSSPISEVLGSMVIIAIVWFGSNLILNDGDLQPEIFITYIVLFYQIINPAKSLSTAFYDIKRGEASAARILDLFDTPNPMIDEPDALPKATFDSEIRLCDVSFRYGDPLVLRNIDLTISKGKTLALVGQSGSGKTTLASLLNRFYDVSDGRIEIDGTDLRRIRLHDLRKLIGYITQDAILFNDSIRNNLLLAKPDASEEELVWAARIANAHEFILAAEQGYDTVIGDRGLKLSGGQRQRLTIARAVLKNPPILILDEATSSLDSESEKLVQDALEKLTANRTSIIIAHRLSTVQHADEIAVLKAGRIIERGNHDQLMALDGEYRKLVALQAL